MKKILCLILTALLSFSVFAEQMNKNTMVQVTSEFLKKGSFIQVRKDDFVIFFPKTSITAISIDDESVCFSTADIEDYTFEFEEYSFFIDKENNLGIAN